MCELSADNLADIIGDAITKSRNNIGFVNMTVSKRKISAFVRHKVFGESLAEIGRSYNLSRERISKYVKHISDLILHDSIQRLIFLALESNKCCVDEIYIDDSLQFCHSTFSGNEWADKEEKWKGRIKVLTYRKWNSKGYISCQSLDD